MARRTATEKSESQATPRQSGRLVVVGTGIRSAGQLTPEAAAWIRTADRVVYVVGDEITERAIQMLNPTAESLSGRYAPGKVRLETYYEMVNDILTLLRTEILVCAVFYGHPGVFAFPSHESIRQARAEGYAAMMLPGISAEDCLFADLGVDPGMGGCQSYEATDFLIHRRAIDASSALLLWQVGALCEQSYNTSRPDQLRLNALCEKLAAVYGWTHASTLYEAAVYPLVNPTIRPTTIYGMSGMPFSLATTVYIPPARSPQSDERYAWLAQYVH